MDKQLPELVKELFESLSKGQKIVAKYILDNPEEVAFKTASQIGKKVNVSESTVIRLCHSLGLNGFTQLQDMTRKQFFKSKDIPRQYSTIYKFQNYTESILDKENSIFADVLAKDIELINEILKENKEDDIWKAVNTILDADRVVVIGYRISYGPAYWFSFMLNLMRGNVFFHPSTRDPVEEMINLTKKSVVVAISFPRYTNENVNFVKNARDKGARIIAITDHYLSPIGRISNITLTTEANTISGMDAVTPITALLNIIISGLCSKHKEHITTRLTLLEEEYSRQRLFDSF